VERPSFHDKRLVVERRSLRTAAEFTPSEVEGALVETTEYAMRDSPAMKGEGKRKRR
jgi:hypothetical protein